MGALKHRTGSGQKQGSKRSDETGIGPGSGIPGGFPGEMMAELDGKDGKVQRSSRWRKRQTCKSRSWKDDGSLRNRKKASEQEGRGEERDPGA